MGKILLAIDAMQTDITAIDFACYIANLTRSKLIGVFLEKNKEAMPEPGVAYDITRETIVLKESPDVASRQKRCEENIQLFIEACMKRGIRSEIIRYDTTQPAQKIIQESRFADLVIIRSEMSFEKNYEGVPTRFTKTVLDGAECPVLIAPLSFGSIDEIIFAYDGSRSSVFAIKQFTYLFPQFADKKVILLEVNEHNSEQVEEKEKIGALLKMHYSGIGFRVLHGKAEDELFRYLLEKKNSFVVMGAFGRGLFSRLFKQSTASLVLKTINCPFFIAHH